MPFDVQPQMVSLSTLGTHRFARCWAFVRTDGFAVFITDHDVPLVLSDGNVYEPNGGVGASADSRRADYTGDDRTFTGVLTSEKFVDEEIAAGLWANAVVTEYLVDHRYPWAGQFLSRQYRIGEIRFNHTQQVFEAEAVGLMAQLGRKVGRKYSRRCHWVLGDAQCGVDLELFSASFTVTGVDDDGFTAALSRNEATGYFNDGEITWSTGDNAGSRQVVKSYDSDVNRFRLHFQPRRAVSIGDTGIVRAGCNKKSGVNRDGSDDPTGDCLHKFNNILRFGGFPTMPEPDDLYEVPDARTVES